MCVFLPHGQGRSAQGGGHLAGHRWQQQTDTDGGGINTLINNYLNNDTGVCRRTEGEKEMQGEREREGWEDMRKRERSGGDLRRPEASDGQE